MLRKADVFALAVCSVEEGIQARCGPGATCLILGGVPTCHCIRDVATGLPLAGNPYRGCTWDLTGRWELHWTDHTGTAKPLYDPFGNEPFIIQIDRTDAILKTQYMTGAIFVVTAVTGAAAGVCARVFVDVNDNQSVILELAEGFVDRTGRNLFFRKKFGDASLMKKFPKDPKKFDPINLAGGWKKWDGSKVKIVEFRRKYRGMSFKNGGGNSAVLSPGWAYWYNDDSFGAPSIRLSTALFVDDTLPFEMAAFDTTNRFVQLGWFGYLAMGASTIQIISPADGKQIFGLRRMIDYPAPLAIPPPPPAVITLTGHDQIASIASAAAKAIAPPIQVYQELVENEMVEAGNFIHSFDPTVVGHHLVPNHLLPDADSLFSEGLQEVEKWERGLKKQTAADRNAVDRKAATGRRLATGAEVFFDSHTSTLR